jgi:hypothetical protein
VWCAQVWLRREHNLQVNTRTIQRVFPEIGVPVLTKTPKRRPRQMILFKKDEPGDSMQIDVKVVRLQREKVFQHTALDDCTRYQLLRLYLWQNQPREPAHFLAELRREMPFAIRKLQCDATSATDDRLAGCGQAERRNNSLRHGRIVPRRGGPPRFGASLLPERGLLSQEQVSAARFPGT